MAEQELPDTPTPEHFVGDGCAGTDTAADARSVDDQTRVERDRFRAALAEISDADSGKWGWIAFNALHPERDRG